MRDLNVRLDAFEGPMELLYHLIEKNEINIYDIPIATLTEQYLDTINKWEDRDMDSMSEFIVMAATLLEIKSKMLLPKPAMQEDESDPREELIRRLLEYKKYKDVISYFQQQHINASKIVFRQRDALFSSLPDEQPNNVGDYLGGLRLSDLYRAFQDVLNRRELKTDRVRSGFNSVERDMFTIESKIEYIKDMLTIHTKVTFGSIFSYNTTKTEIVVTFLALLELIKINLVTVIQPSIFQEICIQYAPLESDVI